MLFQKLLIKGILRVSYVNQLNTQLNHPIPFFYETQIQLYTSIYYYYHLKIKTQMQMVMVRILQKLKIKGIFRVLFLSSLNTQLNHPTNFIQVTQSQFVYQTLFLLSSEDEDMDANDPGNAISKAIDKRDFTCIICKLAKHTTKSSYQLLL